MKILALTFYLASEKDHVDAAWLKARDRTLREWKQQDPAAFRLIPKVEGWLAPDKEVDVEIVEGKVRRTPGDPLPLLVIDRASAISQNVQRAIRADPAAVEAILTRLGQWMLKREIVRVIGAGRALLAAALPANRLAHGGARVFIFGDKTPLPNTNQGGGLIAASASGKTLAVLEMMQGVREKAPWIPIVGIADVRAKVFRALCTPDLFVGIDVSAHEGKLELSALADLGEYVISEVLDALVVAAGNRCGINFRTGHEDVGPTGPWHQWESLPTVLDFRARPGRRTRIEWLVLNAERIQIEGVPDAGGPLDPEVGFFEVAEASPAIRLIATGKHGGSVTQPIRIVEI